MQEIINVLKNFEFAHIGWEIMTPIMFSVADFVTGFIQAVINKNVDSQKMRTGLWHKSLLLIILFLSFLLDFTFSKNFFGKGTAIFIIAMEIVSIGENLKKAGLSLGSLGGILKEKSDNLPNDNLNKLINTIDDTLKGDGFDDEKRN